MMNFLKDALFPEKHQIEIFSNGEWQQVGYLPLETRQAKQTVDFLKGLYPGRKIRMVPED